MADEPLQGHIKPSGHMNKQFARREVRESGSWQYLARDRREHPRRLLLGASDAVIGINLATDSTERAQG
jgi:hypothetical protein